MELDRIVIDEAECIGCGICPSRCDYGVLYMDNATKKAKVGNDGMCTKCGLCAEDCPTNAITILGVSKGKKSQPFLMRRDSG